MYLKNSPKIAQNHPKLVQNLPQNLLNLPPTVHVSNIDRKSYILKTTSKLAQKATPTAKLWPWTRKIWPLTFKIDQFPICQFSHHNNSGSRFYKKGGSTKNLTFCPSKMTQSWPISDLSILTPQQIGKSIFQKRCPDQNIKVNKI